MQNQHKSSRINRIDTSFILFGRKFVSETVTNQTKPAAEASKSKIALKPVELEPVKVSPPPKAELKPAVIQKIPPKGESLNNTPSNKTKGFSTRSIYSAGHNLSVPELCPELGARLKLLVVITSAPDHATARMAIRQTWGHYGQRKDVSIITTF